MIIYNGKNSKRDFDLLIASKDVPVPTRKRITETVPYMSGLWDFSFSGGQDEYEAVTLKYEFDVIAETKQELAKQERILTAWAHSRGNQKLYDLNKSTEYFYEVYQAQATWSEEWLQGLLTIEFLCYPFRKKAQSFNFALSEAEQMITVNNDGDRQVFADIVASDSATLSIGSSVQALSGSYTAALPLSAGKNTFLVSGTGSLSINFFAEVL